MNVAFIPVRGGSKSIPLKNIKAICGKPLVYWTVKAACECKYIDRVYVATDSEEITGVVEDIKTDAELGDSAKLVVIGRTPESASDTASTEFAMLEFAEKYEFDNITLIQATSPLLTCEDLDRGFETFYSEGTDSVISVVNQKRFLWSNDENGCSHPINYDVYNRPRRQDFTGYLVENGAFYITSKDRLIKSQNRISGNIRAVEMKEETFFEIDELSDWEIVESLMKRDISSSNNICGEIKMLLTDCDGCLTDAGMYYSEHGDELKKYNTKDGMGFKLLREKGIICGIVTGEIGTINKRRAQKLQLDILEEGCVDKASVVRRICDENGIELKNIVYIGDDINDLDVIKMVGYGCAPADAIPIVKENAKYVTKAKGGEGVIREVIELLLPYVLVNK